MLSIQQLLEHADRKCFFRPAGRIAVNWMGRGFEAVVLKIRIDTR